MDGQDIEPGASESGEGVLGWVVMAAFAVASFGVGWFAQFILEHLGL